MRQLDSSQRPFMALAPALILALLAVALAACSPSAITGVASPTTVPSATSSATRLPTPTPVPHAAVVRVSKVQHFADSMCGGTSSPCANGDPLISGDCGVTVTVSCPGSMPLLSGGFTVDDFLAFVTSSYPSSSSAWTVTAHDEGQDGGSHPVTVTAFVNCLQTNVTVTTQIVSSTPSVPADSNPYAKSAGCPAGTVLTGGGFRGTNSTQLTRPAGNGWQAALSVQLGGKAKPQVFAVCAKSHLRAALVSHIAKTFAPSMSGTVSLSCGAGKLLVGGGRHESGPESVLSDAANNDVSQWQLQVKGPSASGPGATYTATVYAICVTVA